MKNLKLKHGLLFLILALLLVGATFPFTSGAIITKTTSDEIYSEIKDVPEKEAALILGAAAYPSRLSDILKDRVDTGIDLYKAGKVKTLIMSGAPHEAEAMAEYAKKAGVPESALTQDPAGLDTHSSIKNAQATPSLVIVSQAYHLPRALFYARHYDLNAVGMSADKREYANMAFYEKREKLAHMKAIFDVLSIPVPESLLKEFE